MERGEVGISGLVTIEVGMGEGSGVERNSVDCSVLRPSPLQYYAVFQAQITDVLSQFFSAIFISEDEWVVLCVVNVEFDPVSSRVVWIFFVAATD